MDKTAAISLPCLFGAAIPPETGGQGGSTGNYCRAAASGAGSAMVSSADGRKDERVTWHRRAAVPKS
ncbi:MAG: hypothetical protein ACYC5U_06090 [Rhodocyclaceae bacterium]